MNRAENRSNPNRGHPCAVNSCDKIGRGNANGLVVCGAHYQRWKKYGSFSLPERYVAPGGVCTIEGCELPVRNAHNPLCSMHHMRQQRGSPRGSTPKPSACLHCGDTLAQQRGSTVFYCSVSCTAKFHRGMPPHAICGVCQSPFRSSDAKRLYCSDPCSAAGIAETKRWKARSGCHIRRAREHNVEFERFDAREVYERDGWVCQLCKKPVDKALRHPNPQSVSLDHHIPLGMGGPHTRANTQCTHLACNLAKARHDTSAIAKMKRLRDGRTQADKRAKNGPKLRSNSKLQSRGFDKTLRKKMNGEVIRNG